MDSGSTRTRTPLQRALIEATERLSAAGVPSPRYDAEEIAAHSLRTTRRELWRHDEIGEGFWALIERRAAREPLQHLTGRAAFRCVELAVGPGVFVPRPETEVVAEAAIAEAQTVLAAGRRPVVVDLGTGSGAIALSVAHEVPQAAVHAVEVDERALEWARRNLANSRVELHAGDFEALVPMLIGQVDVVVSNPPYVPIGAAIRNPEVAAYDPSIALWSGIDGLDAIRVVERTAARLLRPRGLAVVEHGDLQGEAAVEVFASSGRWVEVRDHEDLARRPRFLTAREGSRRLRNERAAAEATSQPRQDDSS